VSRPALTILDALDDPNLFAPHFAGDTWQPWRSFLAALFGLPLPDDQELLRSATGLEEAPGEPAAEAYLVCGRRAGKSRILALVAVYLATFRDYRPFLAPGETASVLVIAADRRQAQVILGYCRALLNETPLLAPLVTGETAETITLARRVEIRVATASYRTTRGYTLAAVLADELAFWRDETSANPDQAILEAVRPGLATTGGPLLCASSPHRKSGELWRAFRTHHGQPGDVLVWQAATRTMNPSVPQAVIDRAYQRDAAAASAEFGAQFRDDLAGFVDRAVIEGLVERDVTVRSPQPGVEYRAFLDPSGGARDSFVLAIGHLEGEERVLDVVLERRPPFSPEAVVAEMAETMRDYRVSTALGDRYAGQWPVEAFRRHGVIYEQAAEPKSQIYLGLLPMINSGRVRLLDVPALVGQLAGLERRTARGGRDSVDHAPGGRDDVANACAGVLTSLGTGATFFITSLADDLPEGALGPRSLLDAPTEAWLNY
jgi:hypothetical protein